jgi:endonuclease YncB( thermonuclease family)
VKLRSFEATVKTGRANCLTFLRFPLSHAFDTGFIFFSTNIMAKAIEQLAVLTVGHFGLGQHGAGIGSPAQQVHDGDTVNVRALGGFGVRFLGIDAPEVSFDFPGGGHNDFVAITNPKWEEFLSDPFNAEKWGDITLSTGLKTYLKKATGPGTAQNHAFHAKPATDFLTQQVQDDLTKLGKTKEEFAFFLAFGYEIMDGYGRLLAYINADYPQPPRPTYYNERLLEAGLVVPYFIFPNVDPFVKAKSPVQAVGASVEEFRQKIAQSPKLTAARAWVKSAREAKKGLYQAGNPLRLLPFELRYLAQRRPPSRWVIDLGKTDNVLLRPEKYYTIANLEDRLFVPDEFVPLFVENGWRRGR